MGPGAEPLRGEADRLREATVRASDGGPPVPLALLGRTRYAVRPAQIRTERGETVAYVYVDLTEGTDVAGYVERARAEVAGAVASGEVRLEAGERIEWTGQYELLLAGERRLAWIAPLALLAMLLLLWIQFRNVTEGLIVLVSIPFALVGSCWTLYLLSYPLSAPVWVGLLSTIGLAMQTGVVMVVYIDEAFYRRVREGRLRSRADIVEAHAEGTVRRLRPKIMTVTTMAASLLPLLWADGAGAEIVRRVAAPMLGGLATSAVLTLEVLPVVYTIWRHRQLVRAQREGVPIEAIVGQTPAWARAGLGRGRRRFRAWRAAG
jgi:Cu(I)/Ag(I) efflux system membrane protein CusA/SilA